MIVMLKVDQTVAVVWKVEEFGGWLRCSVPGELGKIDDSAFSSIYLASLLASTLNSYAKFKARMSSFQPNLKYLTVRKPSGVLIKMMQCFKLSVSSFGIQYTPIASADPLKRLPLTRAARCQAILPRRTFLAPTAALRGS